VKAWFVTATDTGVGKTTVACALAAAFARRGHVVAAMKPCETGGGDDAERLRAATGRTLDPELVCPYRFRLPASPEAAAHAERAPHVDISHISRAYARLVAGAERALVEGAGGLLVPLGGGRTMADLAAALALPLLIVARPSLGTINHTLLTVEAARRRGLRVDGVIFSRATDLVGAEEASTPEAIARHGQVRILGTLPRLLPGDDAAAAAERHLDLDTL
jgi:dethiobiotin synthetase